MLFLAEQIKCANENLLPLIRLIKQGIIPIIQIGIPIILIILGMLDLGKAVVASKEDEIKSAQKLLIKRAIYAVAIFFIVLIVNLVFGLLGNADVEGAEGYGTAGNSWWSCWNDYRV